MPEYSPAHTKSLTIPLALIPALPHPVLEHKPPMLQWVLGLQNREEKYLMTYLATATTFINRLEQ